MIDFNKIIELVKETKNLVFSEKLITQIKMKGDADFVTAVDLAVSSFLKEELNKLDSNIGFFSEEESGALSDPCWILDPIDGTTNLVFGYRMSSVSLALYSGSKISAGVVYNPFTDECFTAQYGLGAYLNGQKLHVSERRIENSIVEFGAGSTHKEDADANFALAKDIFKSCIDIRRICSSALDLCYIADGRIDGYFEQRLKPWDIAAGSLILTEAGGMISDYSGKPVQFAAPASVVASNGIIHNFILEKIAAHISAV